MRAVLLALIGLLALNAHAAPAPVATLDRATWPEQLASPVLFDVASRAEILGFAHELALSEALDANALADRLGLRQVEVDSVNALRARLWQRLWENFDAAQQSCEQDASFCYAIDDLASLKAQASEFVVADDSFYAKWRDPGRAFNRTYLDELLRQAALFPGVSSEIARFNDREHNGDELKDRVFLLTFDSGPTLAGGSTDWVADYLRKQKMNATFFVLGNNLQLRRDNAPQDDPAKLYAEQCVGVQGWQYRSHAQWVDWQDSIQRSVALVQAQVPGSFVGQFRPPYGQRRADSGEFFEQAQLAVVLWDIDAADSNSLVTAELATDRVLTLMLLWRKGIIVFHDAQLKAKTALPALLQRTVQSGIAWEDCRDFIR
ncbi:polysaccharide deacetylase family protein [Pseudomonas sp. NPDC007930]|uniref:polysaccharide deacetylase family protein n=1 Tax=Pseudomonas sp. NPDC007930 TaxID=3364417 RepID=UPI0036E930F9